MPPHIMILVWILRILLLRIISNLYLQILWIRRKSVRKLIRILKNNLVVCNNSLNYLFSSYSFLYRKKPLIYIAGDNKKTYSLKVQKSFSSQKVHSIIPIAWEKRYPCAIFVPRTTDSQRELFFKNLELLGLGRHFGVNVLMHLGYFRPDYQHPFWYCEFLVHIFQYSTIISTKN